MEKAVATLQVCIREAKKPLKPLNLPSPSAQPPSPRLSRKGNSYRPSNSRPNPHEFEFHIPQPEIIEPEQRPLQFYRPSPLPNICQCIRSPSPCQTVQHQTTPGRMSTKRKQPIASREPPPTSHLPHPPRIESRAGVPPADSRNQTHPRPTPCPTNPTE